MHEPDRNSSRPGNHLPELVTLDALALSKAIREREVSCREVMAAYLDHIEAVNPSVNAIVSLRNRGELLAEATARDAELARGEYHGWLHGMPQAIKDLAPTAGIRTTSGSPLFRDFVPDTDAIIVERVKRAGAIIIGKTNAPEFGLGSQTYNPVFGATRNAYDRTKTAGGSSGGAAVTLALRMLPVADGSDMMGSLRNPAAYNNIIGFRPSIGRVPHGPDADGFGQRLGTEGPMGRTVADVAGLLSLQAGHDPRMPLSLEQDPGCFAGPLERDFTGTRLAWLGDWDGYLPMQPGVMALCERAFADFKDIGCTVQPALPDFSPQRMWDTWVTLRQCAVAANLGALYHDPAKRGQLKPEAQWEIKGGLGRSAAEAYAASMARTGFYRAMQRLFEDHDYLLLPTAQVFPFDVETHWPDAINGVAMDTYHRWMEVVVPGTLSGLPAINVPVGFSDGGLPMGMQIIGPHHGDLAVLQLAHAYEQSSGWTRGHLPPLLTQPAAG